MERMKQSDMIRFDVNKIQHHNRYEWVSNIAYGNVLDIACGIGYGSEILFQKGKIKSYIGMDVSSDAIEQAKRFYDERNTKFALGSAYNIKLEQQSIDSIISLETLEHLETPDVAFKEFKRIIKEDGVLIGSVPTSFYDEYAQQLWGNNPYHKTKFDLEILIQYLSCWFKYYEIYSASEDFGTRYKRQFSNVNINDTDDFIYPAIGENLFGSFMFIASDVKKEMYFQIPRINNEQAFKYACSYAEFYKQNMLPLYQSIETASKYIAYLEQANKSLNEEIRLLKKHIEEL